MGEIVGNGLPLLAAAGGAGAKHHVSFAGVFFYLAIVLAILFAVLGVARKGYSGRLFLNRPAMLAEQLYLFLEGMCLSIIGAHGRKYVPFIATLWLVIFVGNLVALFFGFSPTGNLSFNLGMALLAVGYVQVEGVRAHGLQGHLRHFAGPQLGGVLALLVSPVIFVIEVVSEIMKNVSLSLRLYGNIHGGHEAVAAMNPLGQSLLIPVGEFLLPIKLLTVVVQALIFTLLTCVYLSLVTHHEEEHGEESHAPAHA